MPGRAGSNELPRKSVHQADLAAARTLGREIDVGPTVVIVNEGAAKNLSTSTSKGDAYAFILDQEGLMAGIENENWQNQALNEAWISRCFGLVCPDGGRGRRTFNQATDRQSVTRRRGRSMLLCPDGVPKLPLLRSLAGQVP